MKRLLIIMMLGLLAFSIGFWSTNQLRNANQSYSDGLVVEVTEEEKFESCHFVGTIKNLKKVGQHEFEDGSIVNLYEANVVESIKNINNEKKVKIAYADQDVLGMDLRKLKFEKEYFVFMSINNSFTERYNENYYIPITPEGGLFEIRDNKLIQIGGHGNGQTKDKEKYHDELKKIKEKTK